LCGFEEQTADELLQNAVETERRGQTVADSTVTGVELQDRGDTCRSSHGLVNDAIVIKESMV